MRAIILSAFTHTRFSALNIEIPRLENKRLFLPPGLLKTLSREAFRRIAFYMRENHLGLLAAALNDSESSENEKLVLKTMLKNAEVAARGELALCQDTGTASIYGWKDNSVVTGYDDEEELSAGAVLAYNENNLRASMVAASSFFDEYNTGDNLPVQCHIAACPDSAGGPVYRFLFVAKGGGSSNKTAYFSMTKALLEEKAFGVFLEEKIRLLGTAACPPYRLALVAGGQSPEYNLEVLKLATSEILDYAPAFVPGENRDESRSRGWIRRDRYWEDRIMEIGRRTGLGAQFGGKHLLLDVRVIRLPRHAASFPVSIGVSCSAHRNMLGYVDAAGVYLENLVEQPPVWLKERGISALSLQSGASGGATPGGTASDGAIPGGGTSCGRTYGGPAVIDLNRPMREILAGLGRFKTGDRMLLSGKLIVARDAAHLNWHTLLSGGKELPSYIFEHPIYYAGPSAAPPGKISGSIGPTTAQRMDPYAGELMSLGASLITLSKGNRSPAWTAACKKYGGFYLGAIGGAAALPAEENILSQKIIDYPELGMEAVRLIEVRDFPVFMVVDNRGNDLYEQL
ncbi:MAG: FumA C-terminus/TtdB family hydratase beta subunit [Spirochaetaceae bacterium]|jgi:fumarate hydratase class I|nr:FumA C-terminus/TtdB family hydratase beta subunit [Spirochaetaceae bacterium]